MFLIGMELINAGDSLRFGANIASQWISAPSLIGGFIVDKRCRMSGMHEDQICGIEFGYGYQAEKL